MQSKEEAQISNMEVVHDAEFDFMAAASAVFSCGVCGRTASKPIFYPCSHCACQNCVEKSSNGCKFCGKPCQATDLAPPGPALAQLHSAYQRCMVAEACTFNDKPQRNGQQSIQFENANKDSANEIVPNWLTELRSCGSPVCMKEWDDANWRKTMGWTGHDYCHSAQRSEAVYISDYRWDGIAKTLRGAVLFGPEAESHRGHCHGGSMCAAMDDVIGWTAFMYTGVPWGGATVQVNVSLRKPVSVGSFLYLEGNVVNVSGRKVSIRAVLRDGETGTVYAEADGLTILLKSNPFVKAVNNELENTTEK